jgi:hypothetical protein
LLRGNGIKQKIQKQNFRGANERHDVEIRTQNCTETKR